MAYYVAQVGTKLFRITPAGVATELTLPSGVTIDATKRGVFAVLGRQVLFCYAPSVNLWVDPDGTVRPMALTPPSSPPIVAAGAGTGLTGDYRVRESFVVLNEDGGLLAESQHGPPSSAVTLANQNLSVAGCAISPDTISARREYRVAAGGTLYYENLDLDGNTQTAYTDDTDDAGLALAAEIAAILAPPGTVPGTALEFMVPWKERLFGKSTRLEDVDYLLYTDLNKFYSWPNATPIKPTGQDRFGLTGLLPRRNELVLLKRQKIAKLVGDDAPFDVIDLFTGPGCVAFATCLVIHDIGYWLGEDGVYSISDGEGVKKISVDKVHAWFSTPDYFNRARFPNAFAGYNPVEGTYDLHLAAVGSSVEDRFVSYHLESKQWLGPHRTSAFTPTGRWLLRDADGILRTAIGDTTGFLSLMNQATRRDWAAAISFVPVYGPHVAGTPAVLKHWGQLTTHAKKQSVGSIVVTPSVGELDAAAGATLAHDQTSAKAQTHRRMGDGKSLTLQFAEETLDADCVLTGYEVPYHEERIE